MKMFAYRGKHENFGDELNHWLWERLLPGFFDDDESQLFLGIGSILYDNFDPNMQKIVFGSGYGGYTNPPKVDRNWTFYFVRGRRLPKSSASIRATPSAIRVSSRAAAGMQKASRSATRSLSCRITKAPCTAVGIRPASSQGFTISIPAGLWKGSDRNQRIA